LKNGFGAEVAAIKREYYRICFELVDDLVGAEGLNRAGSRGGGTSTRTTVMALFGAMNWLYTWYNPRVDPDAAALAREISDVFLRGIRGGTVARDGHPSPARSKARRPRKEVRQ